jgi:hypothetical protein
VVVWEHADFTKVGNGELAWLPSSPSWSASSCARCRRSVAAISNDSCMATGRSRILRYNVLVRELLREMLKRERRTATPGLRALAQRAGVLAS